MPKPHCSVRGLHNAAGGPIFPFACANHLCVSRDARRTNRRRRCYDVMEQELEYRGVRYIVGAQQGENRKWAIFPDGAPREGTASGVARTSRSRGAFKEAVRSACAAIDELLDAEVSQPSA